MQSLAERAQAQADFVKEGAKAHVEVTTAWVEVAAEVQHVKNAMLSKQRRR
jgi:hypothetical protein